MEEIKYVKCSDTITGSTPPGIYKHKVVSTLNGEIYKWLNKGGVWDFYSLSDDPDYSRRIFIAKFKPSTEEEYNIQEGIIKQVVTDYQIY